MGNLLQDLWFWKNSLFGKGVKEELALCVKLNTTFPPEAGLEGQPAAGIEGLSVCIVEGWGQEGCRCQDGDPVI